ncbi:3-hydroxyisobutyrate dehydrogenase-like beta-hydroxyacid dehydrogenase [Streptomyces sp. 1114.5]|uniref:NAD(P)-dependent oxidoreductase n=1 Tax=unclassified Streptomyces TaxID=2593676 RepID=UPI000BC46FB3|nr:MULTISPECIES: NAD(P)-binding domain-containing protein [unclassified Streptomyces]RKT18793.1 3-hydroxyisobutyrate dehydrogenase-like beta-hydroxyacid dehydrogenase [Streptomyces sp. 1114.5]SOB84995.1 3-hydroxyisobutyrate dehydrogenase [Streptomyces sp. 1331.2]
MSAGSAGSAARSVTVIGLGPMGQAMAGAYLESGYAVTVWNRTPERAAELVARGAELAPSVEAAVAANELVVLSLTDYDAVFAILEQAEPALKGKVFANLTSDTPQRAREVAAWLADRGAGHLTGGVQTPPSGIGSPESSTFYSGPVEPFQRHRVALEVLTGADYRGDDPGLAQLYYQIQMDLFWTSLVGYLHATAIAEANGISAEEFLPYLSSTAASMAGFQAFYAPRIAAGDHRGDVDRVAMGLAGIEHVRHTAEASGVDGALPAVLEAAFRRAVEAGNGAASLTSLVGQFRRA